MRLIDGESAPDLKDPATRLTRPAARESPAPVPKFPWPPPNSAAPPPRFLPPKSPAPPPLARRRRWPTLLMFGLVVLVFAVKLANYVWPEQIRFPNVAHWLSDRFHSTETWFEDQPLLNSCTTGRRMAIIPGGYVCTAGPEATPAQRIFDTYPMSGGPREAIYASIGNGSVAAANQMLGGVVVVPGYPPWTIPTRSPWSANPYRSGYWRLNYYSLRPTLNLLHAYQQTGQVGYLNALLTTDASFFAHEAHSRYAWADSDTVAFRALVLTYEWWVLRRLHVLSPGQSAAFLHELAAIGDFLRDPRHYQPQVNRSTNESAALLQLAVDFPSLPHSKAWLASARTRLAQSLVLLGESGQITGPESPFDRFYELDRYWQIYQFASQTSTPIVPDFGARVRDLARYATYALAPDGSIPRLGVQLEGTIRDHGTFAAIAARYPTFRYALTQGRYGQRPVPASMLLSPSGQTIIRSGWGRGRAFADQAYLTFNAGHDSTAHSDLDALSFSLYDGGHWLIPSPDVNTRAHPPVIAYFHGTASHNTVVVDGHSQGQGDPSSGPLVTRGAITYQSGNSTLYPGVTHRRTLVMLDHDHFLVIDRLKSRRVHTYQQMFHLFPGARLQRSGLTVSGRGRSPSQSVTITQLAPSGLSLRTTIAKTRPAEGICSVRAQAAEPCYALAYTHRGHDASYTSLISVGGPDRAFSISANGRANLLVVHDHGRVLRIGLGTSPPRPQQARATHPVPPASRTVRIAGALPWRNWKPSGTGTAAPARAAADGNRPAVVMAGRGRFQSITDSSVRADLGRSNLQIRLRVTDPQRVRSLALSLGHAGWATSARIELANAYRPRYAPGWMTISLGRDRSLSGAPGHWQIHGRFDWRRIDAMRLAITARRGPGPAPTVGVDLLRATVQPRSGAVAFVFDDGYQSILPAAAAMHQLKMPGTVAVVGDHVQTPALGYLTVLQLQRLQNQWGWNMVNGTQHHRDPIAAYRGRSGLAAYRQDVLDGATLLERAGLNSAPNWMIDPHGATNDALDSVVGRFYRFARTTDNAPEAYPYGAPLRVKTLVVRPAGNRARGLAAGTPMTRPAQVIAAARDALRYHNTLIVTMPGIRAAAGNRVGYPLASLERILHGLKALRIPVLTLSQLDALDGVPENNRILVRPALPALTTLALASAAIPARQGAAVRLWWLLGGLLALVGLGLVARGWGGRARQK